MQEGTVDENSFILDQYRRFLSSFALAYNHRHKHKGQLFLKRFKRVSLDEEKVQYLICYVHHNPIHHGFTKGYSDWSFSSYNKVLAAKSRVKSPTSLRYFEGIEDFLEIHLEFQVNKQEEF